MRAVEHTIHRGLCMHHAVWVNHTENRCQRPRATSSVVCSDLLRRTSENAVKAKFNFAECPFHALG
jgi:hypothetical protein